MPNSRRIPILFTIFTFVYKFFISKFFNKFFIDLNINNPLSVFENKLYILIFWISILFIITGVVIIIYEKFVSNYIAHYAIISGFIYSLCGIACFIIIGII